MQKLKFEEGFTKIIESGYDEEYDIFFIIMEKIDEDLNTKIKKSMDKKLNLQTTVNIGIELVIHKIVIDCSY